MLSKVCKERLEYLASLKGHTGQAVTVCRVELSDISTELLSLREQLAELKAFISNECFIVDPEDDENCIRAEYHTKYGGLFTAAKPAEIPRHIFSMLVNELRDVPAIGCKRELIIGVLNSHGIVAKPAEDKC